MELTERKKKLLRLVVEAYIDSAEPVGSKTIADSSDLGCSSATIRNEFKELTEMGYLEQPHTSAGRVPTAKGYRLYVNELMREQKLSLAETAKINASLNAKMEQLDSLMSDVGHLAAEVTNYPSMAVTAAAPATAKRVDLLYIDQNTFIIVVLLSNNTVKNKLIHLPFSFQTETLQKLAAIFNASFTGITEEEITPLLISSTERAVGDTMGLCSVVAGFIIEVLSASSGMEAVISGGSSLLKQPEFRDPDKAHKLISYISDASNIANLPAMAPGDVKMLIGPENLAEELKDSSVVLASYDLGDGTRGLIGVVGPTRMDYSAVAAKLSYIAGKLSTLLAAGSVPPAGFGKLMIKGDESLDVKER